MTGELKRRKPLTRKPKWTREQKRHVRKVRTQSPTCAVRGCKRRPTAIDLCITHAKKELDRLCREIVMRRDRRCLSCHTFGESSPLQWAHVLSRKALAIRWSLEPPNSIALCGGCHLMFTMDPPAWQDFVDEHFPGVWDQLRKIRREAIAAGEKVDYAAKLAELRGAS